MSSSTAEVRLGALDERRLRLLARLALVVVVIGTALTLALEFAAGVYDEAVFTTLLLSFPVVGFFVLARRPDAVLAWLMVGMGVAVAILGPFQGYGFYAVERDLPLGPLALAIGGPGWVPFIAISGFLLLLSRTGISLRGDGVGSRGRAASRWRSSS